jgi:hypothetical protein
MQLMPATAAYYRVRNSFDAIENMLGAARYLNDLMRWQAMRGGRALSLVEVIAAYNAGPGAVERHDGMPPYAETREYVARVLRNYAAERVGRKARYHGLRVTAGTIAIAIDPHDQLAEIRRQRARALSTARRRIEAPGGVWSTQHR